MTATSGEGGGWGGTGPNRAEIIRSGFSTPADSPHVPSFPFSYRNAEILTLAYRTSPDAIARLLPEPLEPTGDVVLIHIYKLNDTDWLGPYTEANIMVGARLPGGAEGAYSPWLFLSSSSGVSQGREVHGQPKKDAKVQLRPKTDAWVGRVRRNGIDVVTGTMAYKQRRCGPESLKRYMDFGLNLNLKVIDHIDGRPAIRQITARRFADLTIHESWEGPCTVELRPNVQAPVYRLPVLEMLDGFYWRADFTLVPGVILLDYLATPPAAGSSA
ncbi:acetoacetate decarboxylase [Methylobacterium nodulans]|uniref:Acetoacetate decarboxylase n=1 Tax=Methylobacterium nodulans (strain LMG 21967 / CNCM I-2342 / ORS 2060) TaxID=460265 RepID=B8IQQ6_METNO|nr:acetoacetate decarboxylase [Methylobacterium nodulans]ACL62351.1 Acetoacetate decarboxylase [Methylobacterium nodulans ORS 2060]